MPIRNIPKNYRNVTGVAANSKSEGKAMYESTLERDWLTLLQFSADVERFEVQPVKVPWFDEKDKERSYTPDVLVYYRKSGHKPLLCEVKYRDELREKWSQFKPKFQAAYRLAKDRGWRFKLITEKHIRTQLLDNAKFLLPFTRRAPADSELASLLLNTLTKVESYSVQELLNSIDTNPMVQAEYIPLLWYLIGTLQVGADLTQKLTMVSTVWSVAND
ncbi:MULTISPECIES: TnsA endonuclease N-terminal domain-containing protein [Shewanella]|uniref:TnsA endonuclease N-terminal domain-containing protein n=1 Tax=Shewanella TaxID=22 RepID=UPI000DB28B19|nr:MULTISPECIES: TnsA endonuclease N-terminal domain-containing protein [Shewanella]MCH7424282.1 TnsA endonuclease N-terminal domain-containing protein [Shewanella sp. MM_2022_3]MCT8865132.1 TnsA endonuclease N-terminal domain-containing protein [Shewanella xiamenensis]MCT8877887.1 TnsA endonuclease N-terminal domain-containing protein [Shewanella xiamenensis]PZP37343.1 MAG: heteromeric transposase endonuclease subunit TnsA [Shewanella oneidensis]